MGVAFIAIGDELLRGDTHESNGHHLAKRLEVEGVPLIEARHISDARADIVRSTRELAERADLVIITGGLGPTDDDQTRAAMAEAAGVTLQRDDAVLAALEARYTRRGRPFTETNRRQASFPVGSEVLRNNHGTAPGFSLRIGGAVIACFPGVPRELRAMLADHLPDLLGRAGIEARPRGERLLRIFGITESGLQERIAALPGYAGVTIRSLPRFPEIRLHIAAGDVAARDAFLAHVRADLGWRVFSETADKPIGAVVKGALGDHTVAVAESCTGGLIGDLLTDAPGMSAHLLADLVCYHNDAKRDLLGVPQALVDAHGAVSEPVAAAMAEGARARTGADFAIATTGIAGPGGGSEAKPVGTICIGLSHAGGTETWRHVFPGLDRRRFKLLVAWAALSRLRRAALARVGDSA